MLTRVRDEIDVLALFKRDLDYPVPEAITWQGKTIEVKATDVSSDDGHVYVEARRRGTRYLMTFDGRKWRLVGVDDSDHYLRPKCFPPPM